MALTAKTTAASPVYPQGWPRLTPIRKVSTDLGQISSDLEQQTAEPCESMAWAVPRVTRVSILGHVRAVRQRGVFLKRLALLACRHRFAREARFITGT